MSKQWLAGLVGALAVVACGGGGGGTEPAAAPVSKAVTAQGTITGFGSVIVDGVRYETSRAEFEIDDVSGRSQDDLSVGQRITVQGRVDDNGNRSAERVRYEAELNGVVTAVDAAAGRFQALGQSVQVDESTVYRGLVDLSTLAVGEFVEVSGNRAADGSLLASFVKREAVESEVQLRGAVSGLDGSARRFNIGSQAVDYASAVLRPAALVLADNVYVEVEGALQSGLLVATKIKREDDFGEAASGSEVSLEGLIRELAEDRSSFRINGNLVRLGSSTVYTGGSAADLASGVKVEAEGQLLADGSLQARKLDIRLGAGRAKGRAEASISAIDSANRRFTVLGVAIEVGDSTVFRDSRDDNSRFGFAGLMVGDYVEVGFSTGANGLKATKVERDRASSQSLFKTAVDRFDAEAQTLVLGGVNVSASGAVYRAGGVVVSASQFYQQLAAGRVVKAKGSYADGRLNAREVELEGSEED